MPLRDLYDLSRYNSTNYSSVPGDTPGGGWKERPPQIFPPGDVENLSTTGGPDFLLRGGYLVPRNILRDGSRLLKLFGSTRGILFTAKQNILSLSNVNSGAGYEPFEKAEDGSAVGDFLRNNIALNQGIYTPLSTIGQAVGNALGIHLNKQGLNPLTETTIGSPDGNTPLGLPTYLNTIAADPTNEDTLGRKSRLLPLAASKIDKDTQAQPNLYSYSGGPGATLGVGKTNINMISEYRTGKNNSKKNFWLAEEKGNYKKKQYFTSQFLKNVSSNADVGIFGKAALLEIFLKNINGNRNIGVQFYKTPGTQTFPNSVYSPETIKLKTDTSKLRSGIDNEIPIQVLTQAQTEAFVPTSKTNLIPTPYFQIVAPNGSQQMPKGLDLQSTDSNGNNTPSKNRIESRVNLGDPGRRGNLQSFTIGKLGLNQEIAGSSAKSNSSYKNAVDKINAFPLYKSSAVTADNDKNDLVKFRIGVFANDGSGQKTYIHFRALINGMSDSYTSDWDAQKFMGRGENFYRYSGFDRTVSLSWTVAAQSKQELIPMHQKLNYLASVCAPDYSSQGYMQGNLISLTIGGWFQEQVGIMKGITLDVPDESPWEIAIPDSNNISVINPTSPNTAIKTDPSVKEMPMIVNVTGFEFIPIHNFVPRVQQNEFAKNGKLNKYGKQHYINLAAATGNNYDGQGDNINYIQK